MSASSLSSPLFTDVSTLVSPSVALWQLLLSLWTSAKPAKPAKPAKRSLSELLELGPEQRSDDFQLFVLDRVI